MNAYSQPNSTFRHLYYSREATRLDRSFAELSKKMAEAEFISKAMKDCYPAAISLFTIWEARTVGQEAFFKSLKVKCRPIGEKPIKPGTFLFPCNTIDAHKEKLKRIRNLNTAFLRADS